MNGYLLDTNVVSELRKPKPHGGVIAWLSILSQEQIFISAVTFGELQAGIELTRDQDIQKAEEIESWATQIIGSYSILPMDTQCFREWARLIHKQTNQLDEDAMIAATARIHQLTVATRDVKDFQRLKVDIVNPFKMAFL